ncbi:acetyl-CoA carboxylase biotin carboxylase subunit family protein [Mesorhizobium sp. M0047]|uniref:ATP-grasp domain-containing protein n=1 Tax=Mesorhizobium sp. M0047 TaxID=2956859 RepID=UPI00333C330A
MARRALVLIEGTTSNGPLYVQAAQRLGLNPITLSGDPAQYDYLAAEGDEAIRVDTDNLDALIGECSRLRAIDDIAGITSATESFYATVGKLCRYFNLPGPNPASVERCCDKFLQRQLLAKSGVPVPAFRVVANVTDAETSAVEIGLPVVLKPAVGIGSSGVQLCRKFDEVTEHATYLFGGKHRWLSSQKQRKWESSPRIMVEEFAQGAHYCANIMGNDVTAIAAVEFGPPPHFVIREYTFPAPLTDSEHKRITDVSLDCLRALDLGWGPTNIEFRWTKRGPVVIEVNPRMAAGDPKLIQLAYGVDLIAEHLKLVIGEEWDLRKRHSQTVAWRSLLPDCDGILDWIDGGSRAAAVPGVAEVKLIVQPKTPIVRKGDCRDSMACVIAVAPNLAQTQATLQLASGLIDWSITPFPAEKEQSRAQIHSAPVPAAQDKMMGIKPAG